MPSIYDVVGDAFVTIESKRLWLSIKVVIGKKCIGLSY